MASRGVHSLLLANAVPSCLPTLYPMGNFVGLELSTEINMTENALTYNPAGRIRLIRGGTNFLVAESGSANN
eukprot:3704320-Amphidinium_carterae.1